MIDAFDHVSLDLKPDLDLDPPVEIANGGDLALTDEPAPRTRAEWKAAREACLTLVSGRDACGKIVVSGTSYLAGSWVVDDDLAGPGCLDGIDITVLECGEVLAGRIGVPGRASLTAGQRDGVGEVRKPWHLHIVAPEAAAM